MPSTAHRPITRFAIALVAAALCAYSVNTNLASACGPVSDELMVRWVVGDHLRAVKTADADLFDSVWADSGKHVKMIDGGELGFRVESEPIKTAFARWATEPDQDMQWTIEMVDVVDGRMGFAKVAVTWHGTTYIEYLTLFKLDNEWKLVEKTHLGERVAPKATAVFGY